MCVTLAVGCIATDSLGTGTVTALLAASFGRSAWLAFLHRREAEDVT
jgi:hypothetical protein